MYKLAVIIFIVLISCNDTKKEKDKKEQVVTTIVESETDKIKLTDLDSKSINLNQYKGKTIFINFWATWCKPCLQEMPSIQHAQELLKNENIIYLFASDEAVEQIEKFKTNHPYPFHYVKAENIEALNIMALPTTYIFNPEGKLVFSEMGFRKWDDKNNIDLLMNIIKSK
jgi:thiol-disulfide isomerase/thioredoxin